MKITKFFLMLSAAAALCVSCGGSDNEQPPVNPPVSGDVMLTADPAFILNDGTSATQFKVMQNGQDVTSKSEIYMVGSTSALGKTSFSSTAVGIYNFYASYDAKISPTITVTVVSTLPQLPADPQPTGTSFVRRVMALQMTGTNCGYCPYMITVLRQIAETDDADKYVLAAVHAYSSSDPMYSSAVGAMGSAYGNGSFPAISTDLRKNAINVSKGVDQTKTNVLKLINDEYNASAAKAGISVAVEHVDDQLVIVAGVKAAQKGSYRVGAWLLEDGISAKQANTDRLPGDFDTHESVVRAAVGRPSSSVFYGDLVGDLTAGQSKSILFSMPLDAEWNLDNCKVVVFVTTTDKEGATQYYVNNVVTCDIDATKAFEYK